MGTIAISEDPDEMPHFVAFHQGLHCLQKKKSSEKEIQYFLKIIICNPPKYTMDHPSPVLSLLFFFFVNKCQFNFKSKCLQEIW